MSPEEERLQKLTIKQNEEKSQWNEFNWKILQREGAPQIQDWTPPTLETIRTWEPAEAVERVASLAQREATKSK